MTLSIRHHRALRLALFVTLLGGTSATVHLLLNAGSECRTDSDCEPGQQCMKVVLPHPSGVHRFITPKVCETPCETDRDCPVGHACVMVDHGPGPDPFCLKTRPK